jgi:hypothetical protein
MPKAGVSAKTRNLGGLPEGRVIGLIGIVPLYLYIVIFERVFQTAKKLTGVQIRLTSKTSFMIFVVKTWETLPSVTTLPDLSIMTLSA